MPRDAATIATSEWPRHVPTQRSAVESERSRCHLDTESLRPRCDSSALAMPMLPSEFSKSIGLTLCGIVELPVSPATLRLRKYPSEM